MERLNLICQVFQGILFSGFLNDIFVNNYHFAFEIFVGTISLTGLFIILFYDDMWSMIKTRN